MKLDLDRIDGFEWDDGNRDKNLLKHDITTGEAEEVFNNLPLKLYDDPEHSEREQRYLAYGKTNAGKLLTVIFTIRENKIRVISARQMHKKERKEYNVE